MNMNKITQSNNLGASLVLVLLVCAAIIAIGFYIFSPVMKTYMRQFYTDELTWSAKRIAADPAGYAQYGADRAAEAARKCLEHGIALRQEAIRNDRLLKQASSEKTSAQELFNDFRKRFLVAEERTDWPLEIMGATYDKPALERQIIDLKQKHAGLEAEIQARTSRQAMLQDRLRAAERTRARALELNEEFGVRVQTLKLDQSAVSIDALEDAMRLLDEVHRDAMLSDEPPSAEALIQQRDADAERPDFDTLLETEL
jgi:hypothetical protein